jgi:hypothetical protein
MNVFCGPKLCPRCRELKPLDAFGRNRRQPDGAAWCCRECFRIIHGQAYRRRKEREGKTVAAPRARLDGKRWCPDRNDYVDEADFAKNAGTRTGFGGYCKKHNNERGRVSRQKVHGGNRHYHLVRRYGISAAEADEMLHAQAALCPICRRPLSKNAHVDHEHGTGDVRGLLCFTCNSGLGNFGDDVERLERAAAYLRGDLTAPGRIAPGVYDVAGTTWRAQDSMRAAG